MTLEILASSTPTVVTFAQVGGRISSATVAVYGPSSTTALQTGSATVDSTNTTVATASAVPTQFTSSVGLTSGHRYLLVMDEGPEIVEVERASGTTVFLAHPTMGVIRDGDAIYGLRLAFALTTDSTAVRGKHYRIEWTLTLADSSTTKVQTMFHVVAMPLGDIVTPADVADILEGYGQSQWSRLRSLGKRIAAAANERVVEALESHDRYPHLYGSPDPFRRAGRIAIQLELLERYNIFPARVEDGQIYATDIRAQFAEAHAQAISRLTWYDSDDSRTVETQEARGLRFAGFRQ